MNNPDCLFCGYPRRGDGDSCTHCSGSFPCCKSSRKAASALRDRVKELEEIARRARELQEPDTWHWLGNGSDDLDSMSEGMIVKIRAGDLRQMLEKSSNMVLKAYDAGFKDGRVIEADEQKTGRGLGHLTEEE